MPPPAAMAAGAERGNKTLLLRASRDGTTAQELARRKARDGVAEADGMNSLFKLVDD